MGYCCFGGNGGIWMFLGRLVGIWMCGENGGDMDLGGNGGDEDVVWEEWRR